MSRWEQLFQEVSRIDQLKQDREEHERAERALREEHARWGEQIARELIQQLHARALERAAEFNERTGKRLEVSEPFFTVAGSEAHGHSLALLTIKLEGAELQLYVYRAPGSSPHVHYLPLVPEAHGDGRSSRFSRVISIAGATVDRTPDGGYTLHRITLPGEEEAILTVDDLVFRGFELLVTELRHTKSR